MKSVNEGNNPAPPMLSRQCVTHFTLFCFVIKKTQLLKNQQLGNRFGEKGRTESQIWFLMKFCGFPF